MTRKIITIIILVLGSGFAYGGEKFFIKADANLLLSADENYRENYEATVFYPELTAGVNLFSEVYIYTSYGHISKSGTIEILQEPIESKQDLLSVGLGYQTEMSNLFNLYLQAGIVFFNYEEQALGIVVSDSATGFRVDATGTIPLVSPLDIGISAGYILAEDTVNNVELKLGGFKFGVGLVLVL